MNEQQSADDFRLAEIGVDGLPEGAIGGLPPSIIENCAATAELYRKVGFAPPWISYVALAGSSMVGGGAFVGPPIDRRVEIAYYTLAELEGRGFATLTAGRLVQLAQKTAPGIEIFAKTVPRFNAST